MNAKPFALLAAALVLTGCLPSSKQPSPMPQITPSVAKPPPPAENPGSLFSQNQPTFLLEDTRARRIGDIVTVNIVDTSKSDLKAETKNDKTASNQLGVANYFGGKTIAGNLSGQLGGPNFGMKGATGTTPLAADTNTSSAWAKNSGVQNSSTIGIPNRWAIFRTTPRVIPGRMSFPSGAVWITPSFTA